MTVKLFQMFLLADPKLARKIIKAMMMILAMVTLL